MTPFTAVIVLHDSEAELAALLPSLAVHLPEPPQLVVVDTGSRDGGPELARRHGAELVELADNPGFGAASNAGVGRARHDVTVLLNPDTELIDDSVHELARLARTHPHALHAPRLLERDGSVQRSAHPLPGTAGALLPALVHPPLLPRALRERAEPFRAERGRTVGWAIAACLAARTETLRRLGPFDPGIFLYAEDLDLGLRAADAGVQTWFWPAACVLHTRAHATRRAFGGEPVELLARRRRAVIAARRGPARARIDDLVQALTFTDRILLKTLAGRDTARERRQLAALRAARRAT